ncbi:hypothetical protein F4804DRAFT_338281 [Jackrogersella minutella]|nr:hypothetical protein F4804DRAFT_338281 [Jackrogersella minutella]
MDPSTALNFHQTWSMERDNMTAKHKSVLALQEELLQKEERELRFVNERNLHKLKAAVSLDLYWDTILPMAEKSLKHDLHEIQTSHRNRLRLIEDSYEEQRARHDAAYHGVLKVDAPANERSLVMKHDALRNLRESADVRRSGDTQPEEISTVRPGCLQARRRMVGGSQVSQDLEQSFGLRKPISCIVRHEIVCGKRRLLMRVQSKKRKALTSKELPPKRLRIDTSVNSLRTPASTPSTENTHHQERTITFNEVYQNGNAKHKDTIVEWPINSRKWYILKCEEHSLRFTRNSVQGAAQHLNGNGHGFPDRNRDLAVKTLGYLVLDCTKGLAKLNNQIAEEAYASGYRPPGSGLKRRRDDSPQNQQVVGQDPIKPSSYRADSLAPGLTKRMISTLKKPVAKARQALSTQSSQKSPGLRGGITHPKTFHIYYGNWKATDNQEERNQIYPVMILGWDHQNGSGLKDLDLNNTGLIKKKNQPPSCYIYDSNKIIGWAPGYEDGGSKVRWRKFPVMFFDEGQTVGWLPARDLTPFPLYQHKAPVEPDHPFNAARRWIAEREGFDSWGHREKARIDALIAHPPTPSPLTPTEEPTNIFYRTEEYSRISAATKSNLVVDSEDIDNSSSRSDAVSMGAAIKEKSIEERGEEGGDITGDEDYLTSDSEIDDTLDCEMEDWNRASSPSGEPSNTSNRPWAFYCLRSTDNVKESELPVEAALETQMSRPTASMAAGMGSAHSLAIQACHSSGIVSPITDAQGSYETPTSGTTRSAEGDTYAMRSPGESVGSSSIGILPLKGTQVDASDLIGSITDSHHLTHQHHATSTTSENKRNETGKVLSPKSAVGMTVCNLAISTATAASDEMTMAAASSAYNKKFGVQHMGPLVENIKSTTQINEMAQGGEGVASKAKKHKDDLSPTVDLVSSSSTQPLSAAEVKVPTLSTRPAGSIGNAEMSSADADFELSLYSDGDVSWERPSGEESCMQLFHSADPRTASTRHGPVNVSIDPMKVMGFSRESSADSKKNNVLVLKNKDGSSSRLVFNRSGGSKLGNGLIQARGFIKWLRLANGDIKCFEG